MILSKKSAINLSGKGPKPSTVLLEIVSRINAAYGHLKDEVMAAYQQALSEGFSPEQAKTFIFENTEFSKRTIYRYLPDECKDKHMQSVGQANTRTLPTGNESVEPNLFTQVAELSTFIQENDPGRNTYDRIKHYVEELRVSKPSKQAKPSLFSEELGRCADKIKECIDSLDKIVEKARVYKPLDPERDAQMAQDFADTVTDGIFRIIEDGFRVIFGEWWVEFEKHYLEKQRVRGL